MAYSLTKIGKRTHCGIEKYNEHNVSMMENLFMKFVEGAYEQTEKHTI